MRTHNLTISFLILVLLPLAALCARKDNTILQEAIPNAPEGWTLDVNYLDADYDVELKQGHHTATCRISLDFEHFGNNLGVDFSHRVSQGNNLIKGLTAKKTEIPELGEQPTYTRKNVDLGQWKAVLFSPTDYPLQRSPHLVWWAIFYHPDDVAFAQVKMTWGTSLIVPYDLGAHRRRYIELCEYRIKKKIEHSSGTVPAATLDQMREENRQHMETYEREYGFMEGFCQREYPRAQALFNELIHYVAEDIGFTWRDGNVQWPKGKEVVEEETTPAPDKQPSMPQPPKVPPVPSEPDRPTPTPPPADESDSLKSGRDALAAGNNQQAVKDLTRFINNNPQHAVALKARGNAYSKMDEHRKALEDYRRSVLADPRYTDGWYNRGLTALKIAQLEEARESFERLIKLSPADDGAMYRLGQTYLRTQQPEDAARWLKASIKMNPSRATAYSDLGKAHVATGNLPEALNAFEAYQRAKPGDPKAGEIVSTLRKLSALLAE